MADDKVASFFERVSEMAEDLGLKGDEKNRYVHEHMTRKGFKMVPSYVAGEDDDDDDDGFFSSGSRRSRRSSSASSRRDRDDRNSGGWF